VRLLFGSLLCFALATAIGLGTTWFTVNRGVQFRTLDVGAWSARPKAGTSEIDPYSHAEYERTGTLPLGLGDGVAFLAKTDDNGRTLDGRCEVILNGITPAARFFTLTLYTPDGKLVANSLSRSSFTSQELIRNTDGNFQISVAPRARAGNWLPTGGIERYVLVLRLYDTPIGISTQSGKEVPMPAITTGRCL
jgi:hypothetical protein